MGFAQIGNGLLKNGILTFLKWKTSISAAVRCSCSFKCCVTRNIIIWQLCSQILLKIKEMIVRTTKAGVKSSLSVVCLMSNIDIVQGDVSDIRPSQAAAALYPADYRNACEFPCLVQISSYARLNSGIKMEIHNLLDEQIQG